MLSLSIGSLAGYLYISCMNKILNFIHEIYMNTKSAGCTRDSLCTYYETKSGVKQGCLLSPTLFVLYLNELHGALEGGLYIHELNIRLLLYVNDIVIFTENSI